MGKNLIVLLSLAFFGAGCATLEYQNKINSLEGRLGELQTENTVLKDKVTALEGALTDATKKQKVVLKAPTAKDIQTALKNAGFYQGDVDGRIGSKTKEAVMKFQEANGLNPDGAVGSRTWEKLSEYLNR